MVAKNWRSSLRHVTTSLKNIRLNDNAPSVEQEWKSLPYYHLVPKDPLTNLAYRETLLDLAESDEDFRRQLYIACSRDELFFVNTMLWVYEPREEICLPFITWPFQDRAFMHLDRCMGKEDVGVEKSRDMGVTWIFLTAFFYRWMFRRRQTFGLVSRNEDAVDLKDDPGCLMWKLDFHLERIPKWMRPNFSRKHLTFTNLDKKSVINGFSSTGDAARGGRTTAFGFDEAAAFNLNDGYAFWASTQHVTNSRIMVSTPQGMAGIFAEQMQKVAADMCKISLHWSEHPEKQKGLYTSTDGILEILDEDYEFPPDYPFVLDGKVRSPWYDRECKRHPLPRFIAQELDIDYCGAGSPFFSASVIREHSESYARSPFHRGYLEFSEEDKFEPTWKDNQEGNLFLWCHLTVENRPPLAEYVIGCDIATGVGGDWSTNSVASVLNKETGEKVAELVTGSMAPDRFAEAVASLRKFFHSGKQDAFVNFERNGPGTQFMKHFMVISGHRVHYEQNEKRRDHTPTKNPGWFSNRDTKRILLGEYGKAIGRGAMINRSKPALEEMLHYVYGENGTVDHDKSKSTTDPTNAGENHGDRVIADALAWKSCHRSVLINRNGSGERTHPKEPPVGSMAWRFKYHTANATKSKRALRREW